MNKRLIFAAVVLVLALDLLPISGAAASEPGQRAREDVRTLIGHVHNREGASLADAVVYLKNNKTLVVKTYITDPNGAYRFPALSTSVDYEVHAEFKGARSDTKTLSSFDSRKEAIINLKINSNK